MKAASVPRRHRGFTLVEVLVALVILALMALMAWRALDALISTREVAQGHMDGTMRLQTVMQQFERDVQAAQDSGVASGLDFDGSALRITRRQTDGMQLIAWTLKNGRLYRWAGPTVQRQDDLRESELQSYQLNENDARLIATVDGVSDWQMYFFRGTSWSNAQSSADTSATQSAEAAAAAAAAAAASGAAPTTTTTALPTGVRIVLSFGASGGKLTKTVLLGARP
jgi:general secretion pathway protein J